MNPKIEVTQDVYKRLERLVIGFDTPSNVIERLLDSYDRKEEPSLEKKTTKRLFANNEIQKKVSALASEFSDSELLKYCDKEISKAKLGISFPLFVRVPATASQEMKRQAVKSTDGVSRWTWKFEFQKDGYSYAICTQWYPAHDEKVQTWLKSNSSGSRSS